MLIVIGQRYINVFKLSKKIESLFLIGKELKSGADFSKRQLTIS